MHGGAGRPRPRRPPQSGSRARGSARVRGPALRSANSPALGELLWYGVLPPPSPAHLRSRASHLPHLASRRQSAAQPSLPTWRHLRKCICRHGSIARPSPGRSLLSSAAGYRRHACGSHASVLGHYVLHAFVVTPNHVHLLANSDGGAAQTDEIVELKGITAKRANAMLALTGSSFWQEESYDHRCGGVRDERSSTE